MNIWDLNNINLICSYQLLENSKSCSIKIIKEIISLNSFFIITNDKRFVIFNKTSLSMGLNKKLMVKTILKIFYSTNFQAIILITNDNNIPILKLENKKSSLELNFIGKLIGHLSLIVSGCFVE